MNDTNVHESDDSLETTMIVFEDEGEVAIEESFELDGFTIVGASAEPLVLEASVTKIGFVDEDDTSARDGSRRSEAEVRDFEDHSHGSSERNTFVGDESKHLVIIHDGVHGLNPFSVDDTIKNQPLGVLLGLGFVGEDTELIGEDTIAPFLGLRMDETVEFEGSDGVGRHDGGGALVTKLGETLLKTLPTLSFTTACRSEDEDGVTDVKEFFELRALENEDRSSSSRNEFTREILHILASISESSFELRIVLLFDFELREESTNESHEDVDIILGELGHVGITKGRRDHHA